MDEKYMRSVSVGHPWRYYSIFYQQIIPNITSLEGKMINPWLLNNFVDSCAFDPKYDPEDKAAIEIFRLYEENELSLIIAHSTQKEIDHTNTPSWVKKEAGGLIYTLDVSLTSQEKTLLHNVENILAGNGNRETIIQDARHIFEAQKYGAYFVTADNRLLRKRREIQELCGVTILLPSEFLTIVRSHSNPYKKVRS